jgi:hypothetical protein
MGPTGKQLAQSNICLGGPLLAATPLSNISELVFFKRGLNRQIVAPDFFDGHLDLSDLFLTFQP